MQNGTSQLRQQIVDALPEVEAYIRSKFSPEVLRIVSAEDIAQGTAVKALKALERFTYRGDVSLKAWLIRIAHRVTIDHLRSTAKDSHQRLPEILHDSGAFRPSSGLRRKESLDVLDDALCRLDSHHRLVIALRYRERHSYREIADQIGATETAARGRHRNAMVALKRLLEKTGYFLSDF